MEDFQRHCEAQGCRRLYLWTDKGCNYRFYDRQGFHRIIAISSPLPAGYGDQPNGFTYVKPLTTECADSVVGPYRYRTKPGVAPIEKLCLYNIMCAMYNLVSLRSVPAPQRVPRPTEVV